MDSANLSKVCLIIDSARCHKTVKVRDKCRELNIKHFLIPPRLTGLLQPADVCWFASLKKTYHKLWTDWFINGVKTFTRFENVRSPGYSHCINWLSQMWSEFPSHLIINSFDSCGILNQYDLHLILKQCLTTKIINSDFIDDFIDADNIDGFEDDNDLFDENGEDENDNNNPQQSESVDNNNNNTQQPEPVGNNNPQQTEPVDNNNNINSSQSRNHPSQIYFQIYYANVN
jgi:hypothetical protein